MLKTVTAALGVCLALTGAASASTILNFDDGTPVFTGTNNLTGYSIGDFTFSITYTGNGSSGANLFDSQSCIDGLNPPVAACTGNDDGDLIPANPGEFGVAGNLLILQENGASLDDDVAGNGSITFTLESGPGFQITSFSGIDEGTFSLIVGGTTFATLGGLANGEAGISDPFLTSIIRVGDSFTVQYQGSGAVDAIALSAIPLPAGVLLLLAGLGGLAAVRNRRSKA